MTQADVATKLGMARTNYLRFESGPDTPSAGTLAAIAAAIGVAPQTLTTTDSDEVTLRDLREYAGLNHDQVARELGYKAARSYREIETGTKSVTPELARRLANALGVTLAQLQAALNRSGIERR